MDEKELNEGLDKELDKELDEGLDKELDKKLDKELDEGLDKVSGGMFSDPISNYYETLRAFKQSSTEEEAAHLQEVALAMYKRLYNDHLVRPGDSIALPPDSYALQDQFNRINRK